MQLARAQAQAAREGLQSLHRQTQMPQRMQWVG